MALMELEPILEFQFLVLKVLMHSQLEIWLASSLMPHTFGVFCRRPDKLFQMQPKFAER